MVKKTTRQYKNIAENIAPFSDTVKKILKRQKRRKGNYLKPWEKGFISRLNNIAKKAGADNIVPVTKSQAKKLKKSGLLLKGGLRGVKLSNTGKNPKIQLKNNQLIIISNGRKWIFVPIDFYAGAVDAIETKHDFLFIDDAAETKIENYVRDTLIDEMENVVFENPGKDISFALMTTNGRVDQTKKFGGKFGDFDLSGAFDYMNGFVNKYMTDLGQLNFNITGFVYHIH